MRLSLESLSLKMPETTCQLTVESKDNMSINTPSRNVNFKPRFPMIQSDNKPSQRCGLMS